MEENRIESIKIYPSNWLYNAAVIGFLKSISDIEQYDIEKWLKGNILLLPKDIFTNLKINDRYFSNDKKSNISSIIGQSSLYRNYVNPSRPQDKKGFIYFVTELSQVMEHGQDFCGLCSRNFALSSESVKKLNKIWTEHSKTNGFDIFFSNLQKYNVAHNNLIAPSTGEFPNAFWNLNDSFLVCPLCAYLIIHHHIPFENAKTQNGQIFINARSFKVMWHLNKYASEILNRRNSYQLRQILGISFMELAQKVFTTLGAWSIMNIEMVIRNKGRIDYYSLPYEISRLLLNKDIASLISQTKEDIVLEIVLNGKFDDLLILNQEILRYTTTNSDTRYSKYISKLNNKNASNMKNLSKILPELYVKINSILKER